MQGMDYYKKKISHRFKKSFYPLLERMWARSLLIIPQLWNSFYVDFFYTYILALIEYILQLKMNRTRIYNK